MRKVKYFGSIKENDYIYINCRGNIDIIGKVTKVDGSWIVVKGSNIDNDHLELHKDGNLIWLHNMIVQNLYTGKSLEEIQLDLLTGIV